MTICDLEGMKTFLLESRKRFFEQTSRKIPGEFKISSHAKLELIEYLLEHIEIGEASKKEVSDEK